MFLDPEYIFRVSFAFLLSPMHESLTRYLPQFDLSVLGRHSNDFTRIFARLKVTQLSRKRERERESEAIKSRK